MNSNFGKDFDFDLGIGSSRPKSLKEQKNPAPSYSSYSSSTFSFTTQTKPAWQSNKPSWTHQPAPNQAIRPSLPTGPTSMVGDISGRSWGSTVQTSSSSGIGIVDKNPNLFGDLVGSALGQGKSNSNVPLKSVTPSSMASSAPPSKSSFSMGNMANSLPKTGTNSVKSSPSGYNNTNGINAQTSPNLGGPLSRNMGGGTGTGIAGGISSKKDPFGSLVDFGSKQPGSLNSTTKSNKSNTEDDSFGDFQNAPKSNTTSTFPSSGFNDNNFGFTGSNVGSNSRMDDFGMPNLDFASKNQAPVQSVGSDPLDLLFSSSSAPARGSEGFSGQQSSEVDDWGMDSEFGGGGHDMGGSTTEIEGLPPPPAGVTGSSAKNKGMNNYKQGQYADAIKWLSWALVLFEKGGDSAATMEVLSSRASCYKEVGEYKKAVADCTKVLEHNDANVAGLVQRALLYESMEKYKLGAEDLRTVLKFDPGNRIARSTIHRLTKMAE